MTQERIISYPANCEGVAKDTLAPLSSNPANITITLIETPGKLKREIGCAYIDRESGYCRSVEDRSQRALCIQLFPFSSETIVKLEQSRYLTQVANVMERYIAESDEHPVRRTRRGRKQTEIERDNIFGRTLRTLREIRGLSLTDLARTAGLGEEGRGHISRIEHGVIHSPQLETVQKLILALGIPLEELQNTGE